MRKLLALLMLASGLAMPGTVLAQFERPTVSAHLGRIQSIGGGDGKLAPYLEAKAQANLGRSILGMAAYASFSWESHPPREVLYGGRAPFMERMPTRRTTYQDVAVGLRYGLFPPRGFADVFAGFAYQFVRRNGTWWGVYPVGELGAKVRIPLGGGWHASTGGLLFFPLQGEQYAGALKRFAFMLGVRYAL